MVRFFEYLQSNNRFSSDQVGFAGRIYYLRGGIYFNEVSLLSLDLGTAALLKISGALFYWCAFLL